MKRRTIILLCVTAVLAVLALPWASDWRIRGGKQQAIEEAVEALSQPSFEERERATRFLISLGEDARDALTLAVGSRDAEVRQRASAALLSIDRAREPLDERRNRECRRLIRSGLATAGALDPDGAVFSALAVQAGRAARVAADVARTVEPKPLAHQRAVILLKNLGRSESAPYLAEVIERGEFLPSTMHHAAEGLRLAGGPPEVDALRRAARSQDRYCRRYAVRALAWIGGVEQYPLIREAARDRDRHVRAEAARALGLLGVAESRPLVATLTRDIEPLVRAAALKALANRPDDGARQIAVGALDDESAEVRAQAIRLLAVYGDTGDAGIVRQLLDDRSSLVRGEAVRALGALGGHATAVRVGMRDASPAVRRMALKSARRLEPEERRADVDCAPEESDPYLGVLREAVPGRESTN